MSSHELLFPPWEIVESATICVVYLHLVASLWKPMQPAPKITLERISILFSLLSGSVRLLFQSISFALNCSYCNNHARIIENIVPLWIFPPLPWFNPTFLTHWKLNWIIFAEKSLQINMLFTGTTVYGAFDPISEIAGISYKLFH
jgi:hypothetical protein